MKKIAIVFFSFWFFIPCSLAANDNFNAEKYHHDAQKIINAAQIYLDEQIKLNESFNMKKKLAIIFNVDGALLRQNTSNLELIPETYELYKKALKKDVAIFIVADRTANEQDFIVKNLVTCGIDQWTMLYLKSARTRKMKDTKWQTKVRKDIALQGYEIILNVGEKVSDFVNDAKRNIKLPNLIFYQE